MTITLPDWQSTDSAELGGVLTIHEDYVLLIGGIERWLYRIARKHAGHQEHGWGFTMKQLYEKSGSTARISDFAIDIRKAAEANQIPEYQMTLGRNAEGEEFLHFLRRTQLPSGHPEKEFARHPHRRVGEGLFSPTFRLGFDDEDRGD